MKNIKYLQTAVYRTKIKNLIELYRSFNPLIEVSKDVKSSLSFFSQQYTIETRD